MHIQRHIQNKSITIPSGSLPVRFGQRCIHKEGPKSHGIIAVQDGSWWFNLLFLFKWNQSGHSGHNTKLEIKVDTTATCLKWNNSTAMLFLQVFLYSKVAALFIVISVFEVG